MTIRKSSKIKGKGTCRQISEVTGLDQQYALDPAYNKQLHSENSARCKRYSL